MKITKRTMLKIGSLGTACLVSPIIVMARNAEALYEMDYIVTGIKGEPVEGRVRLRENYTLHVDCSTEQEYVASESITTNKAGQVISKETNKRLLKTGDEISFQIKRDSDDLIVNYRINQTSAAHEGQATAPFSVDGMHIELPNVNSRNKNGVLTGKPGDWLTADRDNVNIKVMVKQIS